MIFVYIFVLFWTLLGAQFTAATFAGAALRKENKMSRKTLIYLLLLGPNMWVVMILAACTAAVMFFKDQNAPAKKP